MNAAVPLTCRTCGEPLSPADEKCRFGHVNPDYVRTLLRRVEPEAPAAGTSFEPVLRELAVELAAAHASGCKVIVNLGQSEAGKSWLIARMGVLRPGTRRATLYNERRRPQELLIQTGAHLPRTRPDEVHVWHLEPNEQLAGPTTQSGSWRVIDIAGELVSDQQLVNNVNSGRPLYDVVTMALAHAAAVVLVIDGEELTREDRAPATRPLAASLDEHNDGLLNELVRLMRFIGHHVARSGAPESLGELEELKAQMRANPRLDLGMQGQMLQVPVLLMISKADAVPRLVPGSDPLRFARERLPRTHARALQNIQVARWAAAAPFVGQSSVEDEPGAAVSAREKLDLRRVSYGVGQALAWLDAELARAPFERRLSTQQALEPAQRWLPWLRATR